MSDTPQASKSKAHLFGKRQSYKADSAKLVVNDNLVTEDEFQGLYWSNSNASNLLLEPPYNPSTLQGLVSRNNILAQCVATMELNVDGTGFTLEPIEQDKEDEAEKKNLQAFFDEPFPETSFISMRRLVRSDLESTGNGYLEVIRNVAGEVVFLRRLQSVTMRLVKLDEPVSVMKTITRNGVEVSAEMMVRERRYCQKVGQQTVFFKEFGGSRDIDRDTGSWVVKGNPDAKALGTEVIHLTVNEEPRSPYGIPRWINQLPSVLGSRKAEEFNLDFFDNGGVPPVVVFVEGGSMGNEVSAQLRQYFNGNTNGKHRAALVEVQSTSGTLDKPGSVSVKTERFGDNGKDALFQTYDKNTEEHVRVGFRLPPLFLGRAQDYNFATAFTAYMVTEAQVFAPERLEFDEMINVKLLRVLGAKTYKFVSKPITLKNVEVQLKAIELVKGQIDGEDLVNTINEIAGLNLKYSQEAVDAALEAQMRLKAPPPAEDGSEGTQQPATRTTAGTATKPPAKGEPKPPATPTKAKKDDDTISIIVDLTKQWVRAMRLDGDGEGMDISIKKQVFDAVASLSTNERTVFNSVLALTTFPHAHHDTEGMGEIAGCCAGLVH